MFAVCVSQMRCSCGLWKISICGKQVCVCVCVYVYVSVCVCMCVHVCMCMCVHVHMRTYASVALLALSHEENASLAEALITSFQKIIKTK